MADHACVQWLDAFYDPFPSMVVSASLLAAVILLTWRNTGRKLVLTICILLFVRYMLWRGLYTLNLDDGLSLSISMTLFLAETYGFVQFLFFSYQAWSPTDRQSPPIETYPSVDIMVTVVDEPLYILQRTLIGCRDQHYPKELLKVYVLDDGQRPEARALAASLGVSYLTRQDRVNAKAGNLNAALERSSGDLIAVFDVDHVPSPDFLMKTVGFFADEEVAIVQTAQDFYNQDIFQRSIASTRNINNEQALFFRTLQAGRDRHNSAFFAGSSGLLRRTALDAIGGFQTHTITEDLHTSLLLHANGYKSCYLNETLATGLMAESFEGHTKQRMRWAKGTAQVLALDNPLFKRGLTWPQRLDYLGSIHYFFLGLPRVIFLLAPLSWLLFSIPAVRADTATLVNFFFSSFLASTLGIRLISRNTRNAFWSDVHEAAICFALTRAVIVGLFSARKTAKFEVTPKGARSEKKIFPKFASVRWHLAVFGLLIFGIANGLQQWFGPNPAPGLSISLWWASFNLILLVASIVPAREHQQFRTSVRRVRRLPCTVFDGSKQTQAEILDITESGAAIRVPAPVFALQKHVLITVWAEDELLTLNGAIVRQELQRTGAATIGVQFEDLGHSTTRALIASMFSSDEKQPDEATVGAGAFGSLWSLLSVLTQLRERLRPSRRRTPRLSLAKACGLQCDGTVLPGTTLDVSFAGMSVLLPGRHELSSRACVLSIEEVELAVKPIECVARGCNTLVRLRVEAILKGGPIWQSWHAPHSR